MATPTINWFSKISDLGADGIASGISGLKNIKLPSLGDFGLTDAERASQLSQVMDQGRRFNAENSARLQAQREAQAPPMNIQRPIFPIMGNASMYQIPNRNFTWQTTPMEQARLAGSMGRPDLSGLLSTGEYGPLAGQQYQYQGGNTMINYGPGGGYGGGFGGGYGFNPWGNYGSNPWGDWTPPDWTPPDWTPPDDPYSRTEKGFTPEEHPPFDPFRVDPEKIYYPPGSLAGQPDIFNDFTKFSLNRHERYYPKDPEDVVGSGQKIPEVTMDASGVPIGIRDDKNPFGFSTRAGSREQAIRNAAILGSKAQADAYTQAQQQAQDRVLQAQGQAHRAYQIAEQARQAQALRNRMSNIVPPSVRERWAGPTAEQARNAALAHRQAQQDRLRQALGFGVPSSALGGAPTGTLSNRATPDFTGGRELANMSGGSRPAPKAPKFTSTGPSASDIRRQQEADAKREAANRAKAAKAASVGQRQTASKGKAQAKVAAQKPTSSLSAGIKAAQKAMDEARKRKQAADARKAVKGATLRRTPQGKWAGGL